MLLGMSDGYMPVVQIGLQTLCIIAAGRLAASRGLFEPAPVCRTLSRFVVVVCLPALQFWLLAIKTDMRNMEHWRAVGAFMLWTLLVQMGCTAWVLVLERGKLSRISVHSLILAANNTGILAPVVLEAAVDPPAAAVGMLATIILYFQQLPVAMVLFELDRMADRARTRGSVGDSSSCCNEGSSAGRGGSGSGSGGEADEVTVPLLALPMHDPAAAKRKLGDGVAGDIGDGANGVWKGEMAVGPGTGAARVWGCDDSRAGVECDSQAAVREWPAVRLSPDVSIATASRTSRGDEPSTLSPPPPLPGVVSARPLRGHKSGESVQTSGSSPVATRWPMGRSALQRTWALSPGTAASASASPFPRDSEPAAAKSSIAFGAGAAAVTVVAAAAGAVTARSGERGGGGGGGRGGGSGRPMCVRTASTVGERGALQGAVETQAAAGAVTATAAVGFIERAGGDDVEGGGGGDGGASDTEASPGTFSRRMGEYARTRTGASMNCTATTTAFMPITHAHVAASHRRWQPGSPGGDDALSPHPANQASQPPQPDPRFHTPFLHPRAYAHLLPHHRDSDVLRQRGHAMPLDLAAATAAMGTAGDGSSGKAAATVGSGGGGGGGGGDGSGGPSRASANFLSFPPTAAEPEEPSMRHAVHLILSNSLMWTTGAATAVSMLGLHAALNPDEPSHIPELRFVDGTLSWLARCAVPVSLFALGLFTAGRPGCGCSHARSTRRLLGYLALKLLVLPWLMVFVNSLLGLDGRLARALVVLTCVPVGQNAFLVTEQYGEGAEAVTAVMQVGLMLMLPHVMAVMGALRWMGLYQEEVIAKA